MLCVISIYYYFYVILSKHQSFDLFIIFVNKILKRFSCYFKETRAEFFVWFEDKIYAQLILIRLDFHFESSVSSVKFQISGVVS